MSKNLGTLTLDMLVNLVGFKRGMKDAENQTKQSTDKISSTLSDLKKKSDETWNGFTSSINNSLNNTQFGSWASDLQDKFNGVNGSAAALGGTLAGLAAGGAVLAFGAMSNLAIETANANMELQKFANLANSSVITFQGLAGASELMGISQDKLADQLKDFNEKLGEFASIGSGGAMDFFEQIAVKTEKGADGAKKLAVEMSKMNGVEALQKYVDKLEEAGVNQQQMSFYLESMGSDLTALIPILENGGKLWKDYQKALEDAGVITSEQAIEKSALLQAQTKSLQLQYSAFKSTLAEQMMPVLSNTISYFTSGTNQGQKFTGILTGLNAVAKAVAMTMVGLNAVIEAVVRKIRYAVENFTEVGITAKNIFNAVANGDMDGVTSALANGFNNIKNNTVSFAEDIANNATRAMKGFGDILSDNTAKADKLANSILDISNASLKSVKNNKVGLTDGVNQNKALNEENKKAASKNNSKAVKDAGARLSSEMEKAILWGASQLQINPNHLASVISFETGGTFSTNARNPKSSGTGLIQFMEFVDGTSHKDKSKWDYYGMSRNQFGALSAMEQMKYVVKYFKDKGLKANASLGQVYDAVTGTGYRKGTQAYNLNKVWDANKDGYIAPGESVTSGAFNKHIKNWFPNGTDNLKLGEALNDIAKNDYKLEQESLKRLEENAKARGETIKYYMSDVEKAQYEHEERLKQITQLFTPQFNETDNQTLQELAILKQRYIDEENKRYQALLNKFNAEENERSIEFQKLFIEANKHLYSEDKIIEYEYAIRIREIDLLEENEDYKDVKKQIALNERNQRLQDYHNEQDIKNNVQRENTWQQYNQRFGEAENPYLADLKLLKDAREQMLITEEHFFMQRQKLQITHYAQMGQAMTGSLMQMVDESSTAYAALFAIQKGFAVAQSIVAIQTALAEAMKLPFPANLGAYATVFAQTANIVSTIRGTTLQGMAHNGMTNIPKEGTWLLDGGERVLNPKQNQDLTRYLQERRQEPQQNNAVQNNIKIVNNFDENMLVDAMNSRRGEQVILNVIRRNKSSLGF